MNSILTQSVNNVIISLVNAVKDGNMDDVMNITNHGRSLDIIDGIPINDIGIQQLSAIHTAVLYNQMEILEVLLMMGADPDNGSESRIYFSPLDVTFGVTPLYIAIYTENIEAVNFLILKGANTNHYIMNYPVTIEEDTYETHPLSFALSLAHYNPDVMFQIINHILSSGQSLDDIYQTVSYPTLISPIERGLYSIVNLLLEKYIHANPNEIEIDIEGGIDIRERRNALMVAIDFSPETRDVISLLIRYGAEPNNNIGFEYTIRQVLHPELVQVYDIDRQSNDFYTAKDIMMKEINDFVMQYNRDPTYSSRTLVTSLDYAFAKHASGDIINILINNGGLLTKRILHREGLIISSEPASQFNNVNPEHIQRITNIPTITSEQYNQCIETMGTGDTLVDFITTEEVPIQNTVILPSSNVTNKICMDRDSFGKYFISRLNNGQPPIHPFTRENITQAPNYNKWIETNYPFGMHIEYNSHRSGNNNTRRGGRGKYSKSKQTRTKRGKGPATSKVLHSIHVWNELRKDGEIVKANINILMESREIFDQYRGKMMEELPENVQQRMSKYSGLVVPMVDFILDIYTLQTTGSQKEFPEDIIMLNDKVIDLFQTYPFLVTIGARSPDEGYDFLTKIQDMTRELKEKRGGKRHQINRKKHNKITKKKYYKSKKGQTRHKK